MVATTLLLGDRSVMEGDRISPLESYGWALEKECCLPDVLCDGCATLANLFGHLNGYVAMMAVAYYAIHLIRLGPTLQHCNST